MKLNTAVVLKLVNKVVNYLDGKKTYIGTALLFVAGGLQAIKAIDDETFKLLAFVAGSITAYGLRSAIKKLE